MELNYQRKSFQCLQNWKSSPNRKPLIIRGARQVGKTTIVNELAKTYPYQILLNLEKEQDIELFNKFKDVHTLVDALCIRHNIPTNHLNETLLFIDEIQESAVAIRLLRYFYEEIPDLHVIAAGSLLEFALGDIKSFPVGRITYLHLYPFNFEEFLSAIGYRQALEQLQNIPVSKAAHEVLLNLFHEYVIVGGMPEIIKRYVENRKVSDLIQVYESIWSTYQDDVAHYGGTRTQQQLLQFLMRYAHLYLDQRIKFQNFGNSSYKWREVSEAFRKLDQARLIRICYPTTDVESPLKPDLKKAPRMQFLDTGLVNYQLGIQAEMLGMKDLSQTFKGTVIPHVINQELISLNWNDSELPFFWVRDKAQSSAKVDLVIQHQGKVFPVEFKSGKTGTLKSLMWFIDQTNHPYAVRMYAGEFSVEQHKTLNGKTFYLMNLPYYLGTQLKSYLDYFIANYS